MIITQPWTHQLPLPMQSVLILALRFADGAPKNHPIKPVQRGYRGHVIMAGKYGRALGEYDKGDSFMEWPDWHWINYNLDVAQVVDDLPHHFLQHLIHGIEILGYKYPDSYQRSMWRMLHERFVASYHMHPETEDELDKRLGDWHL